MPAPAVDPEQAMPWRRERMKRQTLISLGQHIKPGIEIKHVGGLALRFGAFDDGAIMRRGRRLAPEAEADRRQHNAIQKLPDLRRCAGLQQERRGAAAKRLVNIDIYGIRANRLAHLPSLDKAAARKCRQEMRGSGACIRHIDRIESAGHKPVLVGPVETFRRRALQDATGHFGPYRLIGILEFCVGVSHDHRFHSHPRRDIVPAFHAPRGDCMRIANGGGQRHI